MQRSRVSLYPRLFQDLLVSNAEGLALFHPVESSLGVHGGSVGDCGYIRDGKFHKLYSIFGPPSNLNIPAVPRPDDLRHTTHPTGNFTMQSSRSCSFTVNGGVPFTVPPVVVDANISVGHKAESVAFLTLTFGGKTHEVDEWDETNSLQDYLVHYYEAILEHYKSTPVADYGLILLFKTKKARAWCGGIARKVTNSITAKLEVDVGGVAVNPSITYATTEGDEVSLPASVSEGASSPGASGWPFAMTSGPAYLATDSPLFPYTVVVCPVLVRWYDKIRMKFHGLRYAARSSSSAQQSDQIERSYREAGGSQGTEGAEPLTGSSRASDIGHQRVLQHEDDAAGEDEHETEFKGEDEDEAGLEDEGHELHTLLGAILDAILVAHGTAKIAVGDWNAVTAFVKEHGILPSVDCDMHIRLGSGLREQTVAHLIRIEPRSQSRATPSSPPQSEYAEHTEPLCTLYVEHTLDHMQIGWERWAQLAPTEPEPGLRLAPTPSAISQEWDTVRRLEAQLSGSRVTIDALSAQLDACNDKMQELEDHNMAMLNDALQRRLQVEDKAEESVLGMSVEAQGQSTSEEAMPHAQSVPAEPESVVIEKQRRYIASLTEELTARESELSALRSIYEGKQKGRLETERGAQAGESSLTSGGSPGYVTPSEDSDPDSE